MNAPKAERGLKILALSAIVFLAWIAFMPTPGRPQISVTLLGYTEAADGSPLALMTITNLGASKIFVYRPMIEILTATNESGAAYLFPGKTNQWDRLHSLIGSGEVRTFTMLPPAEPTAWRISLLAYNDLGLGQSIKRLVFPRRMPFQIESDWIEGEK